MEHLFLAVLLIRCLAQTSDDCLLPFEIDSSYSLSYNEPYVEDNFATRCVKEFVAGIGQPESFPHVAVYRPSHASFELYDVIVAHFDKNRKRHFYGYQLKEGKEAAAMADKFEKSFVIRGIPAQLLGEGKDWERPSEEEIDAFFGVSGMQWTPRRWKELNNGE